jgi:hypothetical protein
VQLKGGVGQAGDAYEQHADQVADAVVQGKSAEVLLDRYSGGGGAAVQREEATSGTQSTAPTTEQGVTSGNGDVVSGPATQLTPDDVAEEILRRPDLRDDLLQWAERVGGAVYRDKILAAVEKHGGATLATPPAASATAIQGPDKSTRTSAATTTTPEHAVTPAPSTQPAAIEHAPRSSEFATLSGNAIAKTTPEEAAVLNALRADPRRFDPAWLLVAQQHLGVVDATGAFNTETLRTMRTHAGKPALDAAGILNASFLAGIAPGNPLMATGPGFAEQAADIGSTRGADHAAQAVGYANYLAYKADWVKISFLGRVLGPPNGGGTGRGHPYLAARLHAAEAFLRQRHPSPQGDEVGLTRFRGYRIRTHSIVA